MWIPLENFLQLIDGIYFDFNFQRFLDISERTISKAFNAPQGSDDAIIFNESSIRD
jgi:hypothetical protein